MSQPHTLQHEEQQGEHARKKQKIDSDSSIAGCDGSANGAAQSPLHRLPNAVLLATAQDYLLMRDARSLVCSAQWLHSPLRRYRIDEELSVSAALSLVGGNGPAEPAGSAASPSAHAAVREQEQRRWLFGIPSRVRVGATEWAQWAGAATRLHCIRHLHLPSYVEVDEDEEEEEDGMITLHADSLPPQLHTLEFETEGEAFRLSGVRWPATLTALINVNSEQPPAEWPPLPDGLRTLTFESKFNQPLAGLQLPDSITELQFGWAFDQPLSSVRLPSQLRILRLDSHSTHPLPAQLATLANLTELRIDNGRFFKQPIGEVSFPPSLLCLLMRVPNYAHSFALGHLPPSCSQVELQWSTADGAFDWKQLQLPDTVRKLKLTLWGRMEGSFADLHLPAQLVELCLDVATDASLATVNWPGQLRSLRLGDNYSGAISDDWLPASLTSLVVDDSTEFLAVLLRQQQLRLAGLSQLTTLHMGRYAGPIEPHSLPPSLTQLRLERQWNWPVADLHLPAALQQLEFGGYFNQLLSGFAFPTSLTQLSFGWLFNQPLAGVQLPPSLTQLSFGWKFNQPLDAILLPSLTQLTLGHDFNQPLAGVCLPPSLRRLSLGPHFAQPLIDVALPNALQQLHIANPNYPPSHLPVRWPAGLRVLAVALPRQLAAYQSLLPAHIAVLPAAHSDQQ